MRKSWLSSVTREELERLYYEQLLTTEEIGRLFNVSGEMIRLRMVKLDIPRRGAPWSSKERRLQLDQKTLEKLYISDGLSLAKIGQRSGVSQATVHSRLKKYDVDRRDLSTAATQYPRKDFSGDLIEKSYLLGFRQGDLWVKVTNNGPFCGSISVACTSSCQAQISLIQKLFSLYGHISITPYKKGKYLQYSLQWCLNQTFDFLLPKGDFIPIWVLDDAEFFIAYLAGYVDAEGSFGLEKDGTSRFTLGSCDVRILHQVHDVLASRHKVECPPPRLRDPKGSLTGGKYKSKSEYWSLQVRKKSSLYRLCKLLYPHLKHEKRRKQMSLVWDNIVARGVEEK